MKSQYRAGSIIAPLAVLMALALFAAPALAGNTVTVTGDVVVAVPPSADFSGSPTSGKVPLAVQFTDLSTGTITGWAWDFQNDGIVDSTDQNPVYTYTKAGTNTVKLTVSGPAGSDTEVKKNYIKTSGTIKKPVARFTQDRRVGYLPLTVQFTDRSLFDPTEYFWQFGDGATSTLTNPQHTYTRRGVYPVRLDVSNAAGSSTAWSVVVVLRYSWG